MNIAGSATPIGPTVASAPLVGVGMKMYLGYEESLRYLAELAAAAADLRSACLFVLPPFALLPGSRELLAGTGIAHGAQDCHWEDFGPHTGSISPPMLAELGCSLVEVGHAERRRDFGEDDAMTARKAAAASRRGVLPLVCVGEQRRTAEAREIVRRQVDAVLADLRHDAPVAIAYEPAWAIGADHPADAAHLEAAVDESGDPRRDARARSGSSTAAASPPSRSARSSAPESMGSSPAARC